MRAAARAHPQSRPQRALRPTLSYLLRLVVVLLLLRAGLRALDSAAGWDRHQSMLALAAQLDVYRGLFYALLPAALLMLLPRLGRRFECRIWAALCALLGLGCATLSLLGPLLARPGLGLDDLPQWLVLAAAWLGLNVATGLWLHTAGNLSARGRKLLLRAYGLADVLLPAGLWAAYRNNGRGMPLLRPIHVALVCLAPLLPWLIQPLPLETAPTVDAALRQLVPGAFFQVAALPDNTLLLVDREQQRILRLGPQGQELAHSPSLKPSAVMALARDNDSAQLVMLEPPTGRTLALDGLTLNVRAAIPWTQRPADLRLDTGCRTFWDAPAGLLLVACIDGVVRLCPDGATPAAVYGGGMFHDAALDPEAGRLYLLHAVPGMLLTLDAATLEPLQSVKLPPLGERLALDVANSRAYVSFPLRGQVLVVDLAAGKIERYANVFPGVRVLALDRANQRLICGGLSPLVELRRLDDLGLVERLRGPQWLRWIEVDPSGRAAYLASGVSGLWRMDLDTAHGSAWRRLDPFYPLLNLAGAALRLGLNWDQEEQEPIEPGNSEPLLQGVCPSGGWIEAGTDAEKPRTCPPYPQPFPHVRGKGAI